MKTRWAFILFVLSTSLSSQTFFHEPHSHTFSIVARDSVTGEMGVAVQSHWFSVGSIVSWAEAGVGAIATQSMVNVSFGPRGLELLKSGKSSGETLQILLADDDGRDYRQVAIVDHQGRMAVHTGTKCIAEAGHRSGPGFSVQANMMLKKSVWPAMQQAFQSVKGPLAERMLAALLAAQEQGGDIRGKQSAALLVVRGQSTGKSWQDRLIDLRIEDHAEPLLELTRLLKLHRAYDSMNQGDLAMKKNDVDAALRHYGTAQQLVPDNAEMRYWTAVSLANAGRVAESLPIFREIFNQDENWRELTRRLPAALLLNVKPEELQRILTQ